MTEFFALTPSASQESVREAIRSSDPENAPLIRMGTHYYHELIMEEDAAADREFDDAVRAGRIKY